MNYIIIYSHLFNGHTSFILIKLHVSTMSLTVTGRNVQNSSHIQKQWPFRLPTNVRSDMDYSSCQAIELHIYIPGVLR